MKKHVMVMLLALLAAALACQMGPATPALPPPPPTSTPSVTPLPPAPTETPVPTITLTPPLNSASGPPLISIKMFTLSKGWGLIENQLLSTSDGGATWYGVPVPGGTFSGYNGAFFQSELIAYILVTAPDGNSGILNYTKDGGQTWESIPVAANSGQVQFMRGTNLEGFIFQSLGVAAGSQAVAVYQTLDRVNWLRTFAHISTEPQEGNLPFAGIKTGAFFISPSVGWITGSEPVAGFIYVFRTGDAGRNWQQVELPVPTDFQDRMTESYPPVFPDSTTGFLPVDFLATDPAQPSVRAFYVTKDGGNTWTLASTLPRGSAFEFVDASTGWAWADKKLYFTSDGATSWSVLPVAFSAREDVTQIEFIDPRNGWIITVDSKSVVRLYRTSDGGGTWSVVIP